MSGMSFDELVARVERGESLEDALQVAVPDGELELLKRCATVHAFDAALVDALRSAPPETPGTTLEDLIARGHVEPVPGRASLFRVPARMRREHFDRWWVDGAADDLIPEELRLLSKRLVSYLGETSGDEREILYHELLVDRDAALARFEQCYREADERYDLAGCQDLLDVLAERVELLGPEVAAVRNRYRARLRARSLWMDAWYRSARFLLPRASAAAIEDVLDGHAARVLMLWGAGGMGKTSHLRWLIARRCVPAGDACALIDFDEVNPRIAVHEPWLLFLEAAAQLNQQLPEAPFNELLADYPGQRERLRRHVPSMPDGGHEGDALERFIAGLPEVPTGRRIVIVLDTLEEGLLLGGRTRARTDLAPFMRSLAELLDRAPSVRLVLAGRYDLRERVFEFRHLFPQTAALLLPPFEADEARRYLTEYRHISRDDVVEQAVRSAAGIPFKLELIADVAEVHPELEASELEAYANPDLRYVMQRILNRLSPGLRQLLKYGVAPRMLDRGFAEDVLGPWLPDPGGSGLDELWRELKRYAGAASWVTVDPLEADAVRFHPEVLGPMRDLLREEPVHDELHRRAVEWFTERAARDEKRTTDWICEAVYHQFQLDGPDAERTWARCVAQARADWRPDRRRALAAQLLGTDYVDEDGPRGWRDGKPVIMHRTLIRARWELGVAAAQMALDETPEPREAEWLEAEQALADVEYLQSPRQVKPVSEAELSLLRASVSLGRRGAEEARPHLERAMRGKLAREDGLWLSLAFATAASSDGRSDASAHFRVALTLAGGEGTSGADRAEISRRLAEHYVARDDIAQALRTLESGMRAAQGRQATEFRLLAAKVALRVGAPTHALARLDEIIEDEDDIAARRSILRVRALLAAGRLVEARDVALNASHRLSATLETGGPRQRALSAEGREIRGKALAAVLEVESALKDFEDAANRWSRLGSGDNVSRCRVRSAELQLRGMGNFRAAAQRLDQARRSRPRRGEDAWTRCALLGARFQGDNGKREAGLQIVQDTIAALVERKRPPRALIMAAIEGLALAADDRTAGPYLELLCDQLGRVSPVGRLVLLDGLAGCSTTRGDPRLLARLRRLVPSPVRGGAAYDELGEGDRLLMLMRDAELDRVTGRPEHARRTLREVCAALDRGAVATPRLQLLEAAARAGADDVVRTVTAHHLSDSALEERVSPTFDGAVLVHAAANVDEPEVRAELLRRAGAVLDRSTAPPERSTAPSEDPAKPAGPAIAPASRWTALLCELLGDDAERAGHHEEARMNRRRAVTLYDELDDTAARDRVRGRLPGDTSEWSLPAARDEVRVTLRVRSALIAETQWPDGTPSIRELDVRGRLLDTLLQCAPAGALAENPLKSLRPLVDEPAAIRPELTAILLEALGGSTRSATHRVLDVGLRTKDAAIRMLPWELSASDLEARGYRLFRRAPRSRGEPGDVRAIQGGLNALGVAKLSVDGVLGELTRAAAMNFQEDAGLPPTGEADPPTVQRIQARLTGASAPRVTIVRPSRYAEEHSFRGARQGGTPVDWLYERAGFAPVVLDAPTHDVLEDELRRNPPAILHLTVGLVDHHGVPAIDLLGSTRIRGRPSATGRLTPAALDRVIPQYLPSPLLILDVTAPLAVQEMATQLLLRNWFAAELMALGNVRALLATGLGNYGLRVALYEEIIGSLQTGEEVGEVAHRLQSLGGGEDPSARMALSATALFARRPSVRFPHPDGGVRR